MSKSHGIGSLLTRYSFLLFYFSILFILYPTFCHKARCICHICIKTFHFLSFFAKFSPRIFSGGHLYLPAGGNIIQYYDSRYSSLLTDISYAILFSLSSSLSFFMYSRLWILPQICVWPPTSNPDAKRAFLPQQMQGM